MTNDCYNLVKLISAVVGEYPGGSGFELLCERMLPLINAGAVELSELDAAYRRNVLGQNVADGRLPSVVTKLSDPIPVCDRLAHALGFYAASLYVRDESPTLSEALWDDYTSAVDAVRAAVPAVVSEVVDVYGE